jgi:microsomal prostaglandin-E synthase 2
MNTVTLYQFELCPYCHKVKAGLEAKGIAYEKVDVHPRTKKELPPLPEGTARKVPVIRIGDDVVQESNAILDALEVHFPDAPALMPTDPSQREKCEAIARWVDDDLVQILPTVIYGTWWEAAKSAQVMARTTNLGRIENLMVRGGGALVMHQVARRIIKKRGGRRPEAMLDEALDRIEAWLGEDPFLCGEAVSRADVTVHGAMTCVRDFDVFDEMMKRPSIASWYGRVASQRAGGEAVAA